MLPELQQLTYAPFYRPYFEQIREADLRKELENSANSFSTFIRNIPAGRWQHRYAPDKWTIAQVVHHVIESEIIFTYRSLTMAREPLEVNLPGFDENTYVATADLDKTDAVFLCDYFHAVRSASRSLLETLTSEQLRKKGTANGQQVEVQALFFIISGHCRHHQQVINERYLP